MKYFKSLSDMCKDIISYIQDGGDIQCDNSMESMVFGFKCKNHSQSWYIKYSDFIFCVETEYDSTARRLLIPMLSDLGSQNAFTEALKQKSKEPKRHLQLVRD